MNIFKTLRHSMAAHPLLRAWITAPIGFLLYTFMDAAIKELGQVGHWHVTQVIFFNGSFVIATVLALAAWRLKPQSWRVLLRTHYPKLQALRCGFIFFGALGAFYAYAHIPLTTAYCVLFLTPLGTAIAAHFLLKEHLRASQWLAILAGFVAIIVALSPQAVQLSLPLILLGFATLGNIGNWIVLRFMPRDHFVSINFWPTLCVIVLCLPLAIWHWTMPSAQMLLVSVLGGCAGGFGSWLVLQAYLSVKYGLIAPSHYSQILWGGLVGWLFFGDWPSAELFMGAVIIIGSGLYLLWSGRANHAAKYRHEGSTYEPQ